MTTQSITTRFHGPTNSRGARITATCESGKRITIPYDYASHGSEAHLKAIRALCSRLDWHGKIMIGGIKHGYVAVFVETDELIEV